MNYLLKKINKFVKLILVGMPSTFFDARSKQFNKTIAMNNLNSSVRINLKNSTGFSIVESLIAISIVTLSITSATSIVQSSLQNTSLIKARSVASGLAYEGIEFTRNLRDTNNLAGSDFNSGDFASFVATCSDGCTLDTISSSSAYTACNGECAPMQKTNMGYRTSGGTDSPFVRTITAQYNQVQGENAEVKIISEVSYRSSTRSETLRLESYLLDIF